MSEADNRFYREKTGQEVPIPLDHRLIKAIWFPGEDAGGWQVGVLDCTRIAAYQENGQLAPVPCFAVYKGDHLHARVPAHMVYVVYQDPTP